MHLQYKSTIRSEPVNNPLTRPERLSYALWGGGLRQSPFLRTPPLVSCYSGPSECERIAIPDVVRDKRRLKSIPLLNCAPKAQRSGSDRRGYSGKCHR